MAKDVAESPVKIDDLILKRSPIKIDHMHNPWVFHIEIGGYKFTGYFDSWPGFLTMIGEAGTFFAYKWGKLKKEEAQRNVSRKLH